MRLLFARIGRTFCRQCGGDVVRETAGVVATRLGGLPAGTRLLIGFELAVVTMSSKRAVDADGGDESETADELEASIPGNGKVADPITETLNTLQRRGYGRLLVDGQAITFDELDRASLRGRSTLEVIVDR